MRYSGWKAIAELIGIGAIVASLVFVGVEIQQSRQIALAGRQHEQMERELAVHDVIAENIPLLLKIGSGERLSEEEEILANRLVRTLQVAYFFSYSQAVYLDSPVQDAPIRGLTIILHENPGLKTYWRERRQKMNALSRSMTGRALTGSLVDFEEKVEEYLSILELTVK
ncbi:protein of unknown function [uncultured Woeseiaceae bacterium]|uniref:Uncharacterized protein n=1 Tax=uncultured Woeseiaceae bacterium TaxID=1983305 RepID=A0A7D9D209_9GAMM|nr:protein of unknown function [uncultured Woeseiaceae bacterium]